MAMFVLNFGGQLVHLDMATWNLTGSRGQPGFESGRPSTPNEPSGASNTNSNRFWGHTWVWHLHLLSTDLLLKRKATSPSNFAWQNLWPTLSNHHHQKLVRRYFAKCFCAVIEYTRVHNNPLLLVWPFHEKSSSTSPIHLPIGWWSTCWSTNLKPLKKFLMMISACGAGKKSWILRWFLWLRMNIFFSGFQFSLSKELLK